MWLHCNVSLEKRIDFMFRKQYAESFKIVSSNSNDNSPYINGYDFVVFKMTFNGENRGTDATWVLSQSNDADLPILEFPLSK